MEEIEASTVEELLQEIFDEPPTFQDSRMKYVPINVYLSWYEEVARILGRPPRCVKLDGD